MRNRVFVGVDLAVSAQHQAWVQGPGKERLGERGFEHSASAINEFVKWILGLAESADCVLVGTEAPHGPVVEELLGNGIAVYHLNPKQLDRFRERESVAGAKDDRRDARLLAGALETDLHCFRKVEPAEPVYVRLREASREREALVAGLGAHANRLRDELHRIFPQLLELCSAADERWLWDVLELYPTPLDVGRLKRGKLREILKERRIRRISLEKLIDALRGERVSVAGGVIEAARGKIKRLVRTLKTLDSNRREVESEIRAALTEARQPAEGEGASGNDKQRDASIVLSMPGVGLAVGATLLGEASQALQARDYEFLRSLAGVAPVTEASGKRSRSRAKVKMRRACNTRLREALHHMASTARQWDAAAKAHYESARSKGQTHGRALRGVGDRLLRILVAALRAGVLYDPERLKGHYAQLAATS